MSQTTSFLTPVQVVFYPWLYPSRHKNNSNLCKTTEERLIIWTLLDTGLMVSELCALTSQNVLWKQTALQIKGGLLLS